MIENFNENFEIPSKNVRDIEKVKDPQDRTGSLKIMSRSDMAVNPAQANIQSVEYFVKQKKTWQISNHDRN